MKASLPSLKDALRPPIASVVVAAGLLLTSIIMVGQRHPGMDSAVYQAGASAILRGDALYESLAIPLPWADLPFTYPPVAAIIFLPLVPFELHIVWGIMAALCALALGIVVRTSLRTLLDEPNPWLVNALALVPFGLQAVWSTVGLGQVNLLLMALITVDVLAMRGSRYGGVLIGIAASIKLTPLIFIPHLFVTGRRADAARATATFLGLQAFAWLVLPGDSVRFWTSAIVAGNGNRAYEASNQSINGAVQRLTGEAPGALTVSMLLGIACLALMVVFVRRMHERGQPLAAMLVTAFCGLLVSPVTWTHHWVWVVPLGLLLGFRVVRRRHVGAGVLLGVVLLVFSVDFRLLVRHGDRIELGWGPLEMLVGNSYLGAALLTGLALMSWLAARQQLFPVAVGRPLPLLAPPTGSLPSQRLPNPPDRQLVDQRRR